MFARVRRAVHAREEDGASAVEYALLVAAIAALIIVVVFAFGGSSRDIFRNTCNDLKAHVEQFRAPTAATAATGASSLTQRALSPRSVIDQVLGGTISWTDVASLPWTRGAASPRSTHWS